MPRARLIAKSRHRRGGGGGVGAFVARRPSRSAPADPTLHVYLEPRLRIGEGAALLQWSVVLPSRRRGQPGRAGSHGPPLVPQAPIPSLHRWAKQVPASGWWLGGILTHNLLPHAFGASSMSLEQELWQVVYPLHEWFCEASFGFDPSAIDLEGDAYKRRAEGTTECRARIFELAAEWWSEGGLHPFLEAGPVPPKPHTAFRFARTPDAHVRADLRHLGSCRRAARVQGGTS